MNAFDPVEPTPSHSSSRRTSWPLRILVLAPLLLAAFWAGNMLRMGTDARAPRADVAAPDRGADSRATAPAPLGQPAALRSRENELWSEERATIDLFRTASPSVVYITTLQQVRRRFSNEVLQRPSGSGSGFVWDRRGHIVTNYHVVRGVVQAMQTGRGGSQVAQVTLFDQSTHAAEIIGIAPEKDLAVLRIDTKGLDLEPLPIGTSDDLLVGQSVFAIGNPFGLDYSLTTGVVSALGREIEALDRTPIRDVVQTDAAINPGNSGGPLLDSSGRLIGVNTQIYSPSGGSAGIGFAIPVDTVSWVVPDLIEHGRVIRPVLGVETDATLQRRVGLSEGILIRAITPGSGAEKAGLQGLSQDRRGRWQLGDIILAIGEEEVEQHAGAAARARGLPGRRPGGRDGHPRLEAGAACRWSSAECRPAGSAVRNAPRRSRRRRTWSARRCRGPDLKPSPSYGRLGMSPPSQGTLAWVSSAPSIPAVDPPIQRRRALNPPDGDGFSSGREALQAPAAKDLGGSLQVSAELAVALTMQPISGYFRRPFGTSSNGRTCGSGP